MTSLLIFLVGARVFLLAAGMVVVRLAGRSGFRVSVSGVRASGVRLAMVRRGAG